MTNPVRYKVSVKIEESNGLNIGQYVGATCEILVDALYTEPMYAARGKVGITVVDIRLKDRQGRALPTPEIVTGFLAGYESVDYTDDAITVTGEEDGIRGQVVIKLSPDRKSIKGLGVFSAGFWQQRLMAGLHLRIDGQELSCVQP